MRTKRLLSLIMALVMLLTLMTPAFALADEGDGAADVPASSDPEPEQPAAPAADPEPEQPAAPAADPEPEQPAAPAADHESEPPAAPAADPEPEPPAAPAADPESEPPAPEDGTAPDGQEDPAAPAADDQSTPETPQDPEEPTTPETPEEPESVEEPLYAFTLRILPAEAEAVAKVRVYDRIEPTAEDPEPDYSKAKPLPDYDQLKPGAYHYIVTAEGFEPAADDFEIVDRDLERKITLTPVAQPAAEPAPAADDAANNTDGAPAADDAANNTDEPAPVADDAANNTDGEPAPAADDAANNTDGEPAPVADEPADNKEEPVPAADNKEEEPAPADDTTEGPELKPDENQDGEEKSALVPAKKGLRGAPANAKNGGEGEDGPGLRNAPALSSGNYLVGSFSDWENNLSEAKPMSREGQGDNVAWIEETELTAGDTCKAVWVNDNGEITDWYSADDGLPSDNDGNYVVPATGHYRVYLNNSYKLWVGRLFAPSVSNTIQNGRVNLSIADEYVLPLTEIIVTPEANDGYVIDTVSYNDTTIDPEGGVYSFAMPAVDVTVNATFTAIPYAVTVADTEHGTVTANETSDLTVGDVVTLTITPEEGYVLDPASLVVVNVTTNDFVTVENNQFTMPASNVTVSAAFAEALAEIGSTQYVSLREAVYHCTDNASEPQTVTLLVDQADAEGVGTPIEITNGKKVTLYLNGKALTASFSIDAGCTLTITGSGSLQGNITNAGTLNISGGSLTGTITNTGTVAITGGAFSVEPSVGWVAQNYGTVYENGMYRVEGPYVARTIEVTWNTSETVGQQYYASVDDAVAAATYDAFPTGANPPINILELLGDATANLSLAAGHAILVFASCDDRFTCVAADANTVLAKMPSNGNNIYIYFAVAIVPTGTLGLNQFDTAKLVYNAMLDCQGSDFFKVQDIRVRIKVQQKSGSDTAFEVTPVSECKIDDAYTFERTVPSDCFANGATFAFDLPVSDSLGVAEGDMLIVTHVTVDGNGDEVVVGKQTVAVHRDNATNALYVPVTAASFSEFRLSKPVALVTPDGGEPTGYEDLSSALTAANGTDVVTLLQDIDDPYTLSLDVPVRVNKNGHTLTFVVPDWYTFYSHACAERAVNGGIEYYLNYEPNPDATQSWDGRFSNQNLVYGPDGWFVFDKERDQLPTKVTAAFLEQFASVNQTIKTSLYAVPAANDPIWTFLTSHMGDAENHSLTGGFNFRCAGTFSLTVPAGANYSEMFEIDHPDANVTITREDNGSSNVAVYGGQLTYTGSVYELRLEGRAGEDSSASTVTIIGNIVNNLSLQAAYTGKLYVRGTIAKGSDSGTQSLDLSQYHLGTVEFDWSDRTITDYSTTGDQPVLIAENGHFVDGVYTSSAISFDNLSFDISVDTGTPEHPRTLDENWRVRVVDTTTNASVTVTPGADFGWADVNALHAERKLERVGIYNPYDGTADAVTEPLVISTGYPRVDFDVTVSATIAEGITVDQVILADSNPGHERAPHTVTINGTAGYLQIYNVGSSVTVHVGENGAITQGMFRVWKIGNYYRQDDRFFAHVAGPKDVFKNGGVLVLSYKDIHDALGAIVPGTDALNAAVDDLGAGQVVMDIENKQTDALTADEKTALGLAADETNDAIVAAFSIDVAKLTIQEETVNETKLSELDRPVSFTLQLPADADAYAYDVVNLHEEGGAITATTVTTSEIGDATVPVSSALFSTYILRRAGLVFADRGNGTVTVDIPADTFQSGQNAAPVTVQHAPSGGDQVTTVTFDADAAAAIAQNAGTYAVTLDVEKVNENTATGEVNFTITMTANGSPVYSGNNVAGTATVTLPVNMADGTVVKITHTYGNNQTETFYETVKDHKVTVVLTHFSTVNISSSDCVAKVTSGGTETGYTSLADAIAAAANGDTVTLMKNVTNLTTTQEISKSLTLDLNGHTLSGEESSNYGIFYVQSDLTVNDTNGGKIQNTGSKPAIQVKNYCSLTVNGGTFESAHNVAIYGIAVTITITGGTFQSGTNSSGYGLSAVNAQNVTISGGTFIGGANTAGGYADAVRITGTAAISGGTFNTPVPLNYCASGFIPASATTGGVTTYGVQPGWKVTFDPDNGADSWKVAVPAGAAVDAPASAPARPRPATYTYDFLEWRDNGTGTAWDFSNTVIADLTLKAAYHHKTAYYIYYGDTDESSSGWTTYSPILLEYNPVQTGWEEYMAPVSFAKDTQLKVAKVVDGVASSTGSDWFPAENHVVDAAHAGAATFYFCPTPDSSNNKPGDEWETFHTGRYIYMAANHEITVNIVVDGNTVATANTKVAKSGVVTATDYGTVTVKNNTTGAELETGAPKDLTVGVAWVQSVDCYLDVNVSVKQTVSGDAVSVNANTSFQMPDADVTVTVTVNPDHYWQDSYWYTYTWAADYSTVTASRKCDVCQYTETETVNTTYTDNPPATCEDGGYRQYTATFAYSSAFSTQYKDVYPSPLGHDWKAPTYAWTQDGSDWKCTATRVCNRNDTHTETETATATVTTTPATCVTAGQITYTATFTNTAFATQTSTAVIDALNHDWQFVNFTWTGDAATGYTAATANYVCRNDNTHTQTVNATLTETVTTSATPTTAGEKQYTATVAATASLDNAEHTEIKTVTIPATGWTVKWMNYNGVELEKDEHVAHNTTPVYNGATPTKPAGFDCTYTFAGWKNSIDNLTYTDNFPAVTGDVTYTAVYTTMYEITWKDGDGNTLKTDQVAAGATPAYTGATPTKTATAQYTYTFNNTWDPAIVPANAPAIYTAQFDSTLNRYTVSFLDTDGTTVLCAAQQGDYGFTANRPDPDPSKTGSIFDGWYKEGETTEFDFTTLITADTVLIARWTPNDEPYFALQNLSLSEQIGVRFWLNVDALTDAEKADSWMTFAVGKNGTVSTVQWAQRETRNNVYNGVAYPVFRCTLNSIQMADKITATFHYTRNGVQKQISKEYSVKEYIDSFEAYASQYPRDAKLVHALANYGHYAQPFLSAVWGWTYGDETKDHMAMTTHFGTVDQDSAKANTVPAVKQDNQDVEIRFALFLDSRTSLRVYFIPKNGYSGGISHVTVDGNDAQYTVTTATTTTDAGWYQIEIKGISPGDLAKVYAVSVTTTSGEASIRLSAMSYVHGVIENSYYAQQQGPAAMASLYEYYAATKEYIGN